ncbi:MAG: hypothetical protein Q7U38_01940 [Methylobacter sp.]|nr:hypothetical protein [Methylobacter sp.]MDP2098622.1 hypothetical protein [Methylobacter sp.]MDP2426966.1 hypothetical protein [Methylobacter sp.]MDP3056177.1 hypothetical protein [Methylobacter sp.]MDP3360616.1 hypothetical protein [Methylobacter sp.]
MNQPIPDTTKPSRVNRKLKRRWKKTAPTGSRYENSAPLTMLTTGKPTTPKPIPPGGGLVRIRDLMNGALLDHLGAETDSDPWRLPPEDDEKTAPTRRRPRPPKMIEKGVGLVNKVQGSLTMFNIGSILNLLSSPLMTVRESKPGTGQDIRPLLNVVFLCPPKTQAVFCRVLFVMVGLFGQRSALAGACTGFRPHLSPPPNAVESIVGGTPIFTGLPA